MIRKVLTVIFLASILYYLTYNYHSKVRPFTYQSQIWGDKAGYYSYLPAIFIYHFNGENLPENIVDSTGYGFDINEKGMISTKYSSGVAILQLPFFLAAHGISLLFDQNADGFSIIYQKSIDVAGVTYLILGLLLLFCLLARYFRKPVIFLALFLILGGTNLYWYGIAETGMSHVYSFFLFAAYLTLSVKIVTGKSSIYRNLLLGLVAGMIILIRPVNIIFLSSILFVDITQTSDIRNRILSFTKPAIILPVITGVVLIILPQLIYWYHLTGNLFYYSYDTEGFSNWSSPYMLELWFSTYNGLFIFSPVLLLIFPGMYLMVKAKRLSGRYTIILFLVISYVFASWFSWHFGCSYGSRSFIEYYAWFSIPFVFALDKINSYRKMRYVFAMIFLLLIVINIKIIYSFGGCWEGGIWDFNEFFRLLMS